MKVEPNDELRVPDDAARRLLARAAELDGARVSTVTVQQLRQIALESGIARGAFEAALAETRAVIAHENRPSRAAGTEETAAAVEPLAAVRVPLWVRFCMFGVPDRRAATVYYWLFGAAMCAWPLRALIDVPGAGDPSAAGTALGMGFCGFALWSTSRAIRWLDRHGWRSLP